MPVALRDRLISELNKMVEQEIIYPVTVPTQWVSSIVVVAKPNGRLQHKPLVSIVLDPLNLAPHRLQRMLLHLQKYNLALKYKKGKDMFLADRLSRAFLGIIIFEVCVKAELIASSESHEITRHIRSPLKIINQTSLESKLLTPINCE